MSLLLKLTDHAGLIEKSLGWLWRGGALLAIRNVVCKKNFNMRRFNNSWNSKKKSQRKS